MKLISKSTLWLFAAAGLALNTSCDKGSDPVEESAPDEKKGSSSEPALKPEPKADDKTEPKADDKAEAKGDASACREQCEGAGSRGCHRGQDGSSRRW